MVREFPDKTESIVLALAALSREALERAEKWVSRVHSAGGQFILVTQNDYPASLRAAFGPAAPPVLTVLGDTALLDRDAAAVVGTRTPSEAGAELARLCARWCAAHRRVVVSGGAQGIDTVAHQTALDEDGTTIVVLPQGLLSYLVPEGLALALEGGAALLVSQFVPDAPWTTSGAVTRNETIAALARMACVIEPGSPGGSFKTGRDALAQRKPVLVYAGVGGSGGALLREGARLLLGPNGRFSDDHLDRTWAEAARERPNQAELL
jgi:DNA processing protein